MPFKAAAIALCKAPPALMWLPPRGISAADRQASSSGCLSRLRGLALPRFQLRVQSSREASRRSVRPTAPALAARAVRRAPSASPSCAHLLAPHRDPILLARVVDQLSHHQLACAPADPLIERDAFASPDRNPEPQHGA